MIVASPCAVCGAAPSVTVCDRCSLPICHACEVSGGAAVQMLCDACRDHMYANANAVAEWGKVAKSRKRGRSPLNAVMIGKRKGASR